MKLLSIATSSSTFSTELFKFFEQVKVGDIDVGDGYW